MDNVYVTVTMKNRASLNNDARVLRRQDSISLSIAPKGRAATIEVYRRKTTTTPSLQVSDLVGFMYVVCNTVHCTPLATAFDIRFRFRDSEVQTYSSFPGPTRFLPSAGVCQVYCNCTLWLSNSDLDVNSKTPDSVGKLTGGSS